MSWLSTIINWFKKKPKPSIPVNPPQEKHMDKALLIGINAYPSAPLSGCVNDVTDMANFLAQRCLFNSDSIRMLTDQRATTAAIMERLYWLADGTKAGDRILLHYSGHGAQIACRNDASEVDGLSEIICPIDFDWTPQHMITDKQFYAIFSRMAPGAKFNFISDSCHSGDLIREIPGFFSSYLSPKKTPKHYPILACEQWKVNIAKSKKIALKALVNGQLDVGFISGCRSNQTSADTVINGRPNGALTGFLLQALYNTPPTQPTQPINAMINTVRANLRNAGYDQEPQAEGARANCPFLM